jgi:hypothetical protein
MFLPYGIQLFLLDSCFYTERCIVNSRTNAVKIAVALSSLSQTPTSLRFSLFLIVNVICRTYMESATAILTALVLLLTIQRSVEKHESSKKSLKTI